MKPRSAKVPGQQYGPGRPSEAQAQGQGSSGVASGTFSLRRTPPGRRIGQRGSAGAWIDPAGDHRTGPRGAGDQLTVRSSAYTVPWPYQPCTYTVTVPEEPVVKGTVSCDHDEDEVQELAVAPPLTPR